MPPLQYRSLVATFVASSFATSAFGQDMQAEPVPHAPLQDNNSVAMPSGHISAQAPVLTVGGTEPISIGFVNFPSGYDGGGRPATCSGSACSREPYLRSGFYPAFNLQTSLEGGLTYPDPTATSNRWFTFAFGGISESFEDPGAAYVGLLTSVSENGGELERLSPSEFRYTDRRGNVYHIGSADTSMTVSGFDKPVTKVEFVNGRVLDLHYAKPVNSPGYYRLQGVEDNYGYFVKLEYDSNTITSADRKAPLWARRVKAGNLVYDNCDVSANSCTLQYSLESANSWSADASFLSIGNAAGEATEYTQNYYWEITGIKPIGSDTQTITYELCGRKGGQLCTVYATCGNIYAPSGLPSCLTWHVWPGMVNRAFVNAEITEYNPSTNAGGYVLRTAHQNAYRGERILHQRSHPYDSSLRGQYYDLWDYDGTQYGFPGDNTNRVSSITLDDRKTVYQYDTRGNVTQVTRQDAAGTVTRVTTFAFPAACSSRITCNKPTKITDPLGNATDLTYDPVHGGVLTVTAPADDNGVRPQTRYSYQQRYAHYKNSSGVIVPSPSPIWLKVSESFCRTSTWTGTACAAGASDEVITSYDYGPTTGANNLLLRGMLVQADGQNLRTCFGYDHFGRRISQTEPRAGLTACP